MKDQWQKQKPFRQHIFEARNCMMAMAPHMWKGTCSTDSCSNPHAVVEQMVSDAEFVDALGFLRQRPQVHAFELVGVANLSVFEVALELEKHHLAVLGAALDLNWNWLHQHRRLLF